MDLLLLLLHFKMDIWKTKRASTYELIAMLRVVHLLLILRVLLQLWPPSPWYTGWGVARRPHLALRGGEKTEEAVMRGMSFIFSYYSFMIKFFIVFFHCEILVTHLMFYYIIGHHRLSTTSHRLQHAIRMLLTVAEVLEDVNGILQTLIRLN